MSPAPEQAARRQIDEALAAAGWAVQDWEAMNLAAAIGVAVREARMAPGHGRADYLLFVRGKAVGVLEAKPAGYALTKLLNGEPDLEETSEFETSEAAIPGTLSVVYNAASRCGARGRNAWHHAY